MKTLIIIGLILFIVSCCVLAKRYDEQMKKEMEKNKQARRSMWKK